MTTLRGRSRFVTVSVLVSVALSLACATPATAAKRKLRVWLPAEYTWRQMATKFEKENPGVSVDVVYGDMDKLYTMITAGLMPDVWGPWETPGITADVNRNWALDLTPYIARDGKAMNMGDFFPGMMRQFKVRGKQYSLPIFYYVDWFFYDAQKYSQAGLPPPPTDPKDKSWSWERMVANAQKVAKYNTQGQLSQAGVEFGRGFGNWLRLWGVHLYDQEALKTSIPQAIDVSSPAVVEALTKAWELIYRHKVTKPAISYFAGKQAASSMEAGWKIFEIIPLKNFKWALAPLPYGSTNSGTLWPDGLRISRICKDKELAWKFVKFLCAPENMRMIISDPKSSRRGSGVARKSVFSETMAQDIGRASGMNPADVIQIFEGADDVGVVKEQETICLDEDLTGRYLQPILLDLWANKMSPKEAATRLQNQANKALPVLFQRWIRNMKFTGADKVK